MTHANHRPSLTKSATAECARCRTRFPSVVEFDRHLPCTGARLAVVPDLDSCYDEGVTLAPASAQESAMDRRLMPDNDRVCGCGCGLTPRTKRSKFMPGHDRRLMGLLAHAIRNDTNYNGRDPRQVGRELLSEKGMAKMEAEIARSQVPAPRPAPESIQTGTFVG